MKHHDITDLDEAMNAIKEEIIQDLSESVINQNSPIDLSLESVDII